MNRVAHAKLLAELAAISPEAQRIIEGYKTIVRRGRPPMSDLQYRRLAWWWKAWCEHQRAGKATRGGKSVPNMSMSPAAIRTFWRGKARQIETLLGLKRGISTESRRKAIERGKKAKQAIRVTRGAAWQIVPTGLAEAAHGLHHRIVVDRNEAILLREAIRRAYLGE